MLDPTLLLNADATPVGIVPISTLSWQEAISLMWSGRVEALHHYEHWTVHSPTVEMAVPAVVILKRQARVKRGFSTDNGPPAEMVFLRDGYRCQYCRELFPRCHLTLDHVTPRKYGGASRWENLSAACEPCNGRRGHDERIRPMVQPFRPTYSYMAKRMREQPLIIPHHTWNWYLGWPEGLVTLAHPLREQIGRMNAGDGDSGRPRLLVS